MLEQLKREVYEANMLLPKVAKKMIVARPYVYEHGCEAFADGSENQEAVKALLQLIEDYKTWFAEHQ